MTILFRPQGAFGWFSYTTSRDMINLVDGLRLMPGRHERLMELNRPIVATN